MFCADGGLADDGGLCGGLVLGCIDIPLVIGGVNALAGGFVNVDVGCGGGVGAAQAEDEGEDGGDGASDEVGKDAAGQPGH